MTSDEVQKVVRKRPFEPFQILLATGETHDIRHPDLIMNGRQSVIIGIPKRDYHTFYDRTISVALAQVVGVKELNPRTATKGAT